MNKDKLIYFSQNYHMNAISNPSHNKINGCVLLIGFPAVFLFTLKIYTLCVFCVVAAVMLFIISIFAKKIGYIELLNQICLFGVLSILYPFLFMAVSARQLGNYSPMIILYTLFLTCGIFSGIFYTNRKINHNIKYSKKNFSIGINIGISLLTANISWIITRIFSNDMRLILLFVIGCVCMIIFIPKLILSLVQFFTLKKYKLELK